MAIIQRLNRGIHPLDMPENAQVAVGVTLPFDGTAVFNQSFTTKAQIKSNLLNLLKVKSSKLLAIVNLVNGLYSKAVISNLLNGNINLSKISSSILISIILFEFWCSVIVIPEIFFIRDNYLVVPSW